MISLRSRHKQLHIFFFYTHSYFVLLLSQLHPLAKIKFSHLEMYSDHETIHPLNLSFLHKVPLDLHKMKQDLAGCHHRICSSQFVSNSKVQYISQVFSANMNYRKTKYMHNCVQYINLVIPY